MITPGRHPRRSTLLLGLLLALMAGVSGVLALGGNGSGAQPGVVYVALDAGAMTESGRVSSPATGNALNVAGAIDMAGRPSNLCSPTNPAGCAEPWDGAYDVDSLPAWRWRDIDLDMDTSGGWSKAVQNAFKQIPVTISEIFFHGANFLWMLLLFLMKMGFDAKGLLGFGAQSINTGAAFMADKLLYFAIPLSAYVMWKFLKDFIKLRSGNPFGLMRRITVFAVFLGLMWMVSTSSKEAITQNIDDPAAQLEQVGTLPWMAKEVLNFGDKAVAPLAGVVIDTDNESTEKPADEKIAGEDGNLANGPDLTSNLTGNAGNNGSATCTAYIQTIHSNYARGEDSERALIIVSRLWEGTFYQALKSASFGEPDVYRTPDGTAYASDIPDRVMCHYQEAINDTPPLEQQRIARLAYGEAIPAADKLENVPIVFLTGNAVKKDNQRKAMVAWAACRWNGSAWDGQPEFNGAHAESGSENPFKDHCEQVMRLPLDKWDEDYWVFGSGIPDAVSQGDAVHQAQLQAARTWALGYSGANAGGRMIGAFIAFIVALLFLYSFGLLGLGLTVSMMIAVALLALALPAALVLASIGKTKQAAPLLKMTLFSILGHAFLTALLSIIVIISGIFQNLLGSFAGLPLMIRSLTTGLAPIIAFFIVRKIMKSIGMGDILSMSGALSFAGAAALKGGGRMSADAQKKMASGASLKKTPGLGKRLDRLDGMAPTWKNWSPEGRRKRLETNKKQDALERKKRMQRIDERNNKEERKRREQIAAAMRLEGLDPDSMGGRNELDKRYEQSLEEKELKGRKGARKVGNELLNKIDKARMPGSVKDRLKTLSMGGYTFADAGRLALNGGLAAAAIAMGPVGWAALAGRVLKAGYDKLGDDAAKAAVADYLDSGGRKPGEPVDSDTPPHESFSPGAAVSGPGTSEHRTETARATKDLIDATPDTIAAVGKILTTIAASHGIGGYGADGKPVAVTLSEADRDRIAVSGARDFGCDPSMVLTTPGGLAVPTPAIGEARRSLENTEHGLGHFVNWLPEEDQERRTITVTSRDGSTEVRQESASEYAARLMVQGVARGAVGADGTLIDVRSLALGNADMGNDAVIAEIDEWLAGAVNDRLDNFKLHASDPDEEKMIAAAYEKVREEERVVLERDFAPLYADADGGSSGGGERKGTGSGDPEVLAVLQQIAGSVGRIDTNVQSIDRGVGNLNGRVERIAISMDATRTAAPTGAGPGGPAEGSATSGSAGPRAAASPEANAVELAEATKQLMVAVNAARELFTNAKASGDDAKVNAAAGTLSTVMNAFAAKQAELLEAHGHRLVTVSTKFSSFSDDLQKLGEKVEANSDALYSNARESRYLGEELNATRTTLGRHSEHMGIVSQQLSRTVAAVERGIGHLGQKLDDFVVGTISLEEAVHGLNQTMQEVAALETGAAAAAQRALADLENNPSQQIRDARTGKKAYKTPSAGDVAKRSKAEPIPDED